MNTRKLIYFLSVIEHASVRKAAEKLQVAQPTMTQSLNSLESDLGIRLLNRSRSGVSTTSAGELVARRAREILGDVDRLVSEVKEIQLLQSGEVRIGIVNIISPHVIANFVSNTSIEHPGVKVSIERVGSEQLCTQVASGELDLALARMPAEEQSSDLVCNLLLRDPYVIWMHKNHPLAKLNSCTPDDFRQYPWVFSRKWQSTFPETEPLIDCFGSPVLEPTVDSSEMEIAAALIEQGKFLSIWPKKCFSDSFNQGQFAYRDAPKMFACDLAIIRRARREPSPATKQAIQDLSLIFKG